MREQKNRLRFAGTAIANDDVAILRCWPNDLDVGGWKPGVFEPFAELLRCDRRISARRCGVRLDQFAENGVAELVKCFGRLLLRARGNPAPRRTASDANERFITAADGALTASFPHERRRASQPAARPTARRRNRLDHRSTTRQGSERPLSCRRHQFELREFRG